MHTRPRLIIAICLLCCLFTLGACGGNTEDSSSEESQSPEMEESKVEISAETGEFNKEVPTECEVVVSASKRYWEIYEQALKEPKTGLELSSEIKKIKTADGMGSVQIDLIYVVEDEYGCWFAKDHYSCNPRERQREDFIKDMKFYWNNELPYELRSCAPFLEALSLMDHS